ncbi:restriction endonuclease subunit S [Faecalibaculum rodentium]|uniref:restriction endonuclease subunit S n=2 Tax=Erysipelotrichaceae TaxID=128827 RepID=UPI00272D3BD8|nr:restriction endonuclease subunit S [Faecalibaculum rodentium]
MADNVPKIRFPGFTEPWEQRKLGNLFFQTNETVNPKTSNLSLWSLTVESGLTPKPERYDRSAITKKEDQYKMVHPGEIVFNPMNMTIGAIGMNKNSFPIAVSGYYITMKESSSNNKTIDPCFFSEWMCSPNALKLYKNVATGSLIEKQRVQFSTFSKIRAMFPKYEEQKKIGQVFDALDDLITLHQRKLDDLKKLKSGLLQKMFPKAGETVPEVRFPEFTGDWEQRKFKDLVFKSGKKNKKNLPYESFSITNESGFVSQNERFENGGTMKDADKSMYIIVSPNSFAYNPARINVGSIGYQALGKNVIVSSLYEVFKTSHEVDDHFLWYWFKSDHFKRLVESLQEGGVRLYFYFDKLQKGELWLPPIEEQRKIGGYFKSVDNLITLHQRKLDDLKKLKQGLLQQMLV